jgi:hypothetical protein
LIGASGATLIAQLRLLDTLSLVDLTLDIGKIDNWRGAGSHGGDNRGRRGVQHRRRRRVRL